MPIKIAIAGIGNCASSLVQGIAYYADPNHEDLGLQHPEIGGGRVNDLQVVAAFDVDVRKVGRPLEEAMFSAPNNTQVFARPTGASGVVVQMGPILDGVPEHMRDFPLHQRFEPAGLPPVDLARALRESGAEILVN